MDNKNQNTINEIVPQLECINLTNQSKSQKSNVTTHDPTVEMNIQNKTTKLDSSSLQSKPEAQSNTERVNSEINPNSSGALIANISNQPSIKMNAKGIVKSYSYSNAPAIDGNHSSKRRPTILSESIEEVTKENQEHSPRSSETPETVDPKNRHQSSLSTQKGAKKQNKDDFESMPEKFVPNPKHVSMSMSLRNDNSLKKLPLFQGKSAIIRSYSKKLQSAMDIRGLDSGLISSTRNSINGKPLVFQFPKKSVASSLGSLKDRRTSQSQKITSRRMTIQSDQDIHRNSFQDKIGSHRSSYQSGISISKSVDTQAMKEKLRFDNELKKFFNTRKYKTTPTEKSETSHPSETDPTKMSNRDYYEYLLMCQRYLSSEFIHQIDSNDLIYHENIKHNVKLIGPYILGDVLGKGSFAKVKEGISSFTLQRVAVKIISKKRIRKMTGSIENLKTEINLLRKLKHNNIISLIDVFCKVEDESQETAVFNWFNSIEEEPILWRDAEGQESERKVSILKWYMIFDFCPCTLETLIEKNGCLTEDYARSLFLQLCDGVGYLHSMGVIHRDIKPANMLVSPDNIIKISDFGVAEEFSIYDSRLMTCTAFVGTHKFLAPEVILGVDRYSGEKVDIWACGVTLYNMITGCYPFEAKKVDEEQDHTNLVALYDAITNDPMIIPTQVSKDCIDLLQGILHKEVDKRFTLKQIQHHIWSTITETSTHAYSPVFSYPIINEKASQATSAEMDMEPVETTMIPYLELLYGKDIEQYFKDFGSISNTQSEFPPNHFTDTHNKLLQQTPATEVTSTTTSSTSDHHHQQSLEKKGISAFQSMNNANIPNKQKSTIEKELKPSMKYGKWIKKFKLFSHG